MSETTLRDLHEALVTISDEIREEGGEFDFRFSLVAHLFTDALGWSRTVGEGHVNFEDDRKDVLCYDDSDPPFPVIVCETKRPSHDLTLTDSEQLEAYMNGVGSADYGILTNGHEFQLYDHNSDDREISVIVGFDVDGIAETDFEDLTDSQRSSLSELESLHRSRFVDLGDAEYFRETYQEVPVQYQPGTDDEGYGLFLDAVKDSLDVLTDVLMEFFDDYRDRPEDSYPRSFLDSTFPDWKDWREYTGQSGNAREVFCRETAYIILNRALFARIAEDKEIVGQTRLSSRGMAETVNREDRPYLEALMDTYEEIDDHYPDLYELGIFDWWWVSRDKRQQFDTEEERRQDDLESDLNHTLRTVLRRLNRFDFEYVNRDILGHVYEDYLPKQERKELGEYYTPLEVVQFMLDSVDYRPGENLGQKKVLDPACGSGTFLTEVTERLIQHYVDKFGRTSVHRLDPSEARTILERVEENVYGIDINPFAAHITQINLLFRTIDLYDKVTEKDPDYTMDGFEIHVADTLSPTLLEKQDGSTESEGEQSSLEQFAAYNGRAQSFIEDRNEVDRIKDEETFDVVVANPPYVRIQNLSGVKDEYSARYASAIKNFDIYVPFIERGLEWLTEDGKLTYICPNRLLTHEYTKEIRTLLGEEPLTYLLDFKDTDVFDAATPYPCVFCVDRKTGSSQSPVSCARFADEKERVLEEITHLDEWDSPPETEEYDLFEYPQEQLRADNEKHFLKSWKPMPKTERELFDRIEKMTDYRLGVISKEVFVGTQTSANTVFVGEIVGKQEENVVNFLPSGEDRSYPIEKRILKRVLKGKEIDRWGVDWEGLWVILPYQISSDSADIIPKSTLVEEMPYAWEYFKSHEEKLKGRESGKMRDRDDWYGYVYPKNLTKFDSDKIITNIMSSYNRFVADTDSEYYFIGGGNAGGYGIQLREEYAPSSEDLLYYVALLNSQVLEFFHKHIAPIFGGKYYSYNKRYLEPHPIVLPGSAPKEAVERIAEEIKTKREQRTDLRYRTSDVRNYLEEFHRDTTILDLVTSTSLDDDDYRQDPIRTNDKMNVSSERVYQVVMKRGHTLDFEKERVRDFVFELLKAQDKRLGRMEILNLEVPTQDDVLALMEEYESDKARIEELEQEAEELQAELDDLILRDVYDLNDDDVAVVEDFLKVW